MGKYYNILKADKAGDIWTNAHNNQMQTFFLTLEGFNDQRGGKTVLINRQASSPLLSGQEYLSLEEVPSKNKPGTTYFKAKREQAPDGTPPSTQQTLPLAAPNKGTLTWGEALIAASTLLTTDHFKKLLEDENTGGYQAVKSMAKDIMAFEVPGTSLADEARDILPSDDDVDKVDVTSIPF